MVTILAALGGGAFVLTSLVVGLRLMLLARRTRALPEFALGFGLFAMGGIGYPLMAVSMQAKGLPLELRVGMLVTQMCLNGAGMTLVGLFTLRVFRPEAGWARGAVAAIAFGYAAAFGAQAFGPGFAGFFDDPQGPWYANTWLGLVTMAWAGGESIRYYRMLRRRLALGLADPVVTDRFRLWGIGILTAALISASSIVLERVFGVPMAGTMAGALLVGPLGMICSGAMWLAFLPPRAYRARVAARASR